MILLASIAGTAASPASSCPLWSSNSSPRPFGELGLVSWSDPRRSSHIAHARKGLASRTRRLEKRGQDSGEATSGEDKVGKEAYSRVSPTDFKGGDGGGELTYSTGPPPALPGAEPDFWEGPKWNALGFFVQYMWAFGLVFGVIACGIAVATYNEGATDFKETSVYKESIQSRELLEQPEAPSDDVFEANPTEVAPSLE
ncbi:hypothetical protein AXF42_Ash010259 [Apostasia shenzhenica]|uniref:Uncharacterized protein n=1 Tax=Apostasia shenzhenica TaxID=1088818 RepID=A0A2I0A9Y6_9ASPA|nr:hypothetical protein AXF42_Ash010259 [Apostasia shenzhenica]